MNERKEFKEEMTDRIAFRMYRILEQKESVDMLSRSARTPDYNYHDVIRGVSSRISLPKDCRLKLRGYEIILDNPTPVYVRFNSGNYWIGGNLLVSRCLEQTVDMIVNTIMFAVPEGLSTYEEQEKDWEREFNKYVRLRAINAVAEEIRQNNNLQYGYQY